MENIRNSYRYLVKGAKIARVFKKEAGLTTNQSIIVMSLYQRDYSRRELMSETDLENEGQFSRDVIMPLKIRGYIGYIENTMPKEFRITKEGRSLVDRVSGIF